MPPIAFNIRRPFSAGVIPQGKYTGGIYNGLSKLGIFKPGSTAGTASLSVGGAIGAGALGALPELLNGDFKKAAFTGAGSAVGAAIGTAIMPGIGTVLGGIAGRYLGKGIAKLFGVGKDKNAKKEQEQLREMQYRQQMAEMQEARMQQLYGQQGAEQQQNPLQQAYLQGRQDGYRIAQQQGGFQQPCQQQRQPQLIGYLAVDTPVGYGQQQGAGLAALNPFSNIPPACMA